MTDMLAEHRRAFAKRGRESLPRARARHVGPFTLGRSLCMRPLGWPDAVSLVRHRVQSAAREPLAVWREKDNDAGQWPQWRHETRVPA